MMVIFLVCVAVLTCALVDLCIRGGFIIGPVLVKPANSSCCCFFVIIIIIITGIIVNVICMS